MESLAHGIHKSRIKRIWLKGCDIKDESGQLLFKGIGDNNDLEYADLSINSLGSKASSQLCEVLKKGCYSLLVLKTEQNFIKYDQLK